MLKTQLIVLDGLPGSGKTTTGDWLTRHLIEQGYQAWFLPEHHTSHPLWWYNYWDGSKYHPPAYHETPVATFMSNSLARWQEFTAGKQASFEIVVSESLFFQNAVSMFLMGDAPAEKLRAYAHEVQHLAHPLNPILIYFRQNNLGAALRRICKIRGEDFQQELVTNLEGFPYLKNRKLTGLTGIDQLWLAAQTLTDSLYAEYNIPKISIETSAQNWPQYRQEILHFISSSLA